VAFADFLYKTGEVVRVCLDTSPEPTSRSTTETALVVSVAGDTLLAQIVSGSGEAVAVIIEPMQTYDDCLDRTNSFSSFGCKTCFPGRFTSGEQADKTNSAMVIMPDMDKRFIRVMIIPDTFRRTLSPSL